MKDTQAMEVYNAIQLSAGYSHIYAALSNGTVQCWGFGESGQLGNGATSFYSH